MKTGRFLIIFAGLAALTASASDRLPMPTHYGVCNDLLTKLRKEGAFDWALQSQGGGHAIYHPEFAQLLAYQWFGFFVERSNFATGGAQSKPNPDQPDLTEPALN